MVQYYDVTVGRLVVELFDMVEVKDGTAKSLTDTSLSLLRSNGINLDMLVGFCAETCNTMYGAHNSVSVHLKAGAPHLLTVKCSSEYFRSLLEAPKGAGGFSVWGLQLLCPQHKQEG